MHLFLWAHCLALDAWIFPFGANSPAYIQKPKTAKPVWLQVQVLAANVAFSDDFSSDSDFFKLVV